MIKSYLAYLAKLSLEKNFKNKNSFKSWIIKILTLNPLVHQWPIQKFSRLQKICTFHRGILHDVGTIYVLASLGIRYLMLTLYPSDNAYI